jgi:hypothetical protein
MVMIPTRILSIAISSLLLLSAAVAWSDEEGYISDSNGCKIANPSPKPNETVTWSGECKDGFAEGTGVMQWFEDKQPGPRYEGTLAHGALSGEGKLTLPDGSTYEGGWLEGRQSGQGTLKASDGGSYKGGWKNGKPDGHGVMHAATGETVEGVWKDGVYQDPAKEP